MHKCCEAAVVQKMWPDAWKPVSQCRLEESTIAQGKVISVSAEAFHDANSNR
jgi:hypothetical protein